MPDQRDLAKVVLDALKFHARLEREKATFGTANRRLVVASGNALPTAKIIFADEDAVFADEGQYKDALTRFKGIDNVVVLSASGEKHAPKIIKHVKDEGYDPYLITCNRHSTAGRMLDNDHVIETPSESEPHTYNTSTYLGMILPNTGEEPKVIRKRITKKLMQKLAKVDFTKYRAFYLIVPPQFDIEREMFLTKFDELFGGRLNGRCYTTEQTMHAKAVIPWNKELFISFGCKGEHFEEHLKFLGIEVPERKWNSLKINIRKETGHAEMIAIGYYVIGCIQKQFDG